MKKADKIINWIRLQVKKAGVKGIVLGLSGGVDSSLVAALSLKAIGKRRVLGLILPIHSRMKDLKDARLVAQRIKIKTKTVELTRVYDNFIKILPKANRIAYANLKPRLRMTVLYYFANKLNYLVCGTGNRSELMVGYFTKHGDGATDILPIGNLFKREVFKLASKLGIPNEIIRKVPTAGLWQGQTDEGEIGLTYEELDNILANLEGKKKYKTSKNKVNKVKKMIKASGHKRRGPQICN